jgi:hypothetical protein
MGEPKVKRIAILIVLLAHYLTWSYAVAADGSTADKVKALQDLKDVLDAQKKLIDAQKDLLGSQKSLLEAEFPKISGGKEGTIEFKSGGADNLHAHVQTYQALSRAASDVCDKVNASLNDKESVVLLSADDIKMSGQYRIALSDLQSLQKMFEDAVGQKVAITGTGLELYGAAIALTTIADFTKLFRTNRTLYAESTTVADEELTNLVAQCIKRSVIYPAVQFDSAIASGTSSFIDALHGLDVHRAKVDSLIMELSAKEKRTPSDEARLAALKTLAARHDKFVTAMAASDEANKTPILFYLLRGEIVANAVKSANIPLLTTKISKQGGFSMITSSIWRSDRFFSSGGVVVSYRLVSNGQLRTAGSVPADSPFVEVQQVP